MVRFVRNKTSVSLVRNHVCRNGTQSEDGNCSPDDSVSVISTILQSVSKVSVRSGIRCAAIDSV